MKYLYIILFVTISNSCSLHCQNNDLLLLNELYSLDNHSIRYGVNGEILEVWNDKTSQQIKDYSKVEKLIISTCLGCDDTLWVTNEDFPNLKSLVLNGIFFNELVQVSKLKTLQHLDISEMSQGDFNASSYALFFPDEFWTLTSMQSLKLSAGHISDISENILDLNHLKHLEINSHESQDDIAIPWNLLFLKNFEALFFVNMDNYDQEDIVLFREFAPFLVLGRRIEYFKDHPLEYDLKKSRKKTVQILQGQTIKMTKDSLSLFIPLNEEGFPNGTATLKKENTILQKREYNNGRSNDKWYLNFNGLIQKRKYSNGTFTGKWIFMEKAPYFGYRKSRISIKRGGKKIIIRYRPVFNAFRVKYINYNDLNYFERTY